jgi:hypothetical protein
LGMVVRKRVCVRDLGPFNCSSGCVLVFFELIISH